MGIKREDKEPGIPSRGLVWLAILNQIDKPDTESSFLTVTDVERENVFPFSLVYWRWWSGRAEGKARINNPHVIEKIN